ncbi:MAG: acyl-CoA synthetase, partial [Burkholderiales bacterium]|nr:acyl-CoA synthetase [Burkholderiales bacterium]
MSRQWLDAQERSNIIAIRILVWIALFLGRRVARAVLVPVVIYFLLFGARARRASRDYLQRVMGRKPSLFDVFAHFYTFATVALDRVYFLSDQWSLFDIRIHGEELLFKQLARDQGCFLVGAHMGSFECLRTLGRRKQVTVNLVMFEENASRVARVTRAIRPGL